MAATLVDEWARAGLTDVVICPGSRSTPLTLGAARHDGLRVHVRLDERGAAFFALGRALATGHAAAIVVTSGTAAAELHAAVAEADLAHVPLLVVTADRPPEMHGVGASQTINQRDLYGAMVRRFEEPGVARADAAPTWRPLASRLWHAAHGDAGPPGPVHVNLAFVEPLVTAATPPVAGRDNGAPWLERDAPRAAPSHYDVRARRVLCVVGAGVGADVIGDARSLDWVVVGDATARGAVPYADALLRDDGFASLSRPDVVVRVGGLPASRVLAERLREWGVPAIGFEGAGPVADPDGLVSRSLAGLPNPLDPAQRGDARYTGHWVDASARIGEWLNARDATGRLDEPALARAMVAASTRHQVALVVGSSMPVRDVEWWATSRSAPTFANRGANGIDGVVSTLLGVATGSRALGLVGDLTMLHDASALVDGVDGTAVLVVADNDGGGIFSFLPQASVLDADLFNRLFAASRSLDLARVAAGFGHATCVATSLQELADALDVGLATPGLTVVVARVPDRGTNVEIHEALVTEVSSRWLPGPA